MNFDIAAHIHYFVVAGSHAYGMATAESDIDLRGWAIPPKEFLVSTFLNFEQSETKWKPEEFEDLYWGKVSSLSPAITRLIGLNRWKKIYKSIKNKEEPIDAVIFSLRKFIKLAADCNPNVIELLFVQPEDILVQSFIGKMVRENRNLFLSARAKFRYTGYAISQLKRINTHRRWLLNPPKEKPTRVMYGLPEQSLIPADQRSAAEALIEKQVRLWLLEEAEVDRTLVDEIQNDLIELFCVASKEEVRRLARIAAAQKYNMSENFIAVLEQEKKYRAAHTEWKQYQSWVKNRNPARAELEKKYGYDTKHASHLVRLLIQGEEILKKSTLTLKNKEQAELLLSIRKGAWTYEELIEFADKKQKEFDLLYKEKGYVVPKKPDMNKIDNLYREILSDFIK